jgi:hypothetical protein
MMGVSSVPMVNADAGAEYRLNGAFFIELMLIF